MRSRNRSPESNGVAALAPPAIFTRDESLPADRCREVHRHMVRARVMEERMIKMSKSGEGHFWIGGPGEEAFNVCLGLQVHKGFGPAFDFLHLHYRNSATLVAMGMPLIEGVRQMAMTLTDTHSLGRNFTGHFAVRDWNVVPVTPVIEIQYVMAPGTAHVQKRFGGDGVTVVTGGDAGTAEGDFASGLVWSTRPDHELPVLMIVTNNSWGISTPACTQHGEKQIIDRGKAFGIPGEVIDGNDPVASWHGLRRGFEHCRRTRRPYMIEAKVSRLHGHSSSSGAHRVRGEADCIELLEKRLIDAGIMDQSEIEAVHAEAEAEIEAAAEQVATEPRPLPEDVERFTYADSKVDKVYPGDYTGLPR